MIEKLIGFAITQRSFTLLLVLAIVLAIVVAGMYSVFSILPFRFWFQSYVHIRSIDRHPYQLHHAIGKRGSGY